ncbi:hypothetical protein BDB13_2238 [Rhodococcus sp. OK302]|nr:hypothetical protein BDB13_2238 [Rhodococcus sp. OK302]
MDSGTVAARNGRVIAVTPERELLPETVVSASDGAVKIWAVGVVCISFTACTFLATGQ